MAEGLKVLMMGGQRVGKSSALAAIMDAFISGAEKDILTAKDSTTLTKIEGEKQTSIASKLAEVKEMLVKNSGKTIIVNRPEAAALLQSGAQRRGGLSVYSASPGETVRKKARGERLKCFRRKSVLRVLA